MVHPYTSDVQMLMKFAADYSIPDDESPAE